jgi:uncharacterized membrane protein YhhN
MTAAGWIWVAVAVVLAVLDWAAVAAGSRVLERCAKPAVLLALLAAAVTAQPAQAGVHRWLVLALCLGLIGDVALSFAAPGQLPERPERPRQPAGPAEPRLEPASAEGPAGRTLAEAARSDTGELVAAARPAVESAIRPAAGAHRARPAGPDTRPDTRPDMRPDTAPAARPSPLFAAGLASFLLGHLCYCAAILAYGTDQISLGFGLVLVLLALLAFGHRILTGAQAQGGNPLTIAVAAYIATLGSTVVLGIGTASLWVAAGIVLFAFSDLVLATDRFVVRRGWAALTVAVTYHSAQTLLLVGLVH